MRVFLGLPALALAAIAVLYEDKAFAKSVRWCLAGMAIIVASAFFWGYSPLLINILAILMALDFLVF